MLPTIHITYVHTHSTEREAVGVKLIGETAMYAGRTPESLLPCDSKESLAESTRSGIVMRNTVSRRTLSVSSKVVKSFNFFLAIYKKRK